MKKFHTNCNSVVKMHLFRNVVNLLYNTHCTYNKLYNESQQVVKRIVSLGKKRRFTLQFRSVFASRKRCIVFAFPCTSWKLGMHAASTVTQRTRTTVAYECQESYGCLQDIAFRAVGESRLARLEIASTDELVLTSCCQSSADYGCGMIVKT